MKKVKIRGNGTFAPIQKLINLGFKNECRLNGTCEKDDFYYNEEDGTIMCCSSTPPDYEEIFLDKPIDKSIDKVTTPLLNMVFRTLGMNINMSTTDKIIDIIELLEDKGKETTVKDIIELKKLWE